MIMTYCLQVAGAGAVAVVVLVSSLPWTIEALLIFRSTCTSFVKNRCHNPHTHTNDQLSSFSPSSSTQLCMVSELHIPGYTKSKLNFLLSDADDDLRKNTASYSTATSSATATKDVILPTRGYKQYPNNNYHDSSNNNNCHLIYETTQPILSIEECRAITNEVEYVTSNHIIDWTTQRHGNFPTTDIPIIELPTFSQQFKYLLQERIYPNLYHQYSTIIPDVHKLRVVDGFIVKYDAQYGQKALQPHRDGSVLSFNIALNPSTDYVGGGTWFAAPASTSSESTSFGYESATDTTTHDSMNMMLPPNHSSSSSSSNNNNGSTVIQMEQGHMVSHASALLHGGYPISSGIRYILVAFVIVENYDSWSMRFYNQVRNL